MGIIMKWDNHKEVKNGHSRDGVLLLRHTRMNAYHVLNYINRAFFSAASPSLALLSSLAEAPESSAPR